MTKNNKIILAVAALAVIIAVVLVVFTKKQYTVTFDSNGGTTIKDQIVKKNDLATEPTTPIKEGYIFLHWELAGQEYEFDTKVTKNFTLVAKYDEYSGVTRSATFDTDGGSSIGNQTIKEGENFKKPVDPIKEGYTFLYWELDGKEYNFEDEVTENVTLTAKWEKAEEVKENDPNAKYNVTFNSSGTKVPTQSILNGNKVKKPADPTKDGFTFIDWKLGNNTYNFNNSVTKNITLVAYWKPIPGVKYNVTFDSDGGSAVAALSIPSGGKATRPTNPTKNGFTFINWYVGTSVYDFNAPVTGDVSLKAKWEAIPDKYTISIESIDMGMVPQVKVFVMKNGVNVEATEVYGTGDVLLGKYNEEAGAILVNKNYYNDIIKAKLDGGNIVTISR